MTTTSWSLPEIAAGQSQKEITHNTAIAMLAGVAGRRIITRTATAPPGSPVDGGLYYVPSGASGAWSGQAGKMALRFASAWTFVVPPSNAVLHSAEDGQPMRWTGSAWTPAINKLGLTATDTIGLYGAAPVAQPVVTLGNTNGEIGGLSIGGSYSQSEIQALRDRCEELADDVRALHAALVLLGAIA